MNNFTPNNLQTSFEYGMMQDILLAHPFINDLDKVLSQPAKYLIIMT